MLSVPCAFGDKACSTGLVLCQVQGDMTVLTIHVGRACVVTIKHPEHTQGSTLGAWRVPVCMSTPDGTGINMLPEVQQPAHAVWEPLLGPGQRPQGAHELGPWPHPTGHLCKHG